MVKSLLFIALFCNYLHIAYSQRSFDIKVASLSLPVRNSFKFNRNLVNPTFSFVRETNASVSFYSKKQWVQFENAPSTFLVNYSSRFSENESFALGLFQQNYGLITIFGGIVNFAHNIALNQDNNLTFGLNLATYQSGLDKGKIISDDSQLLSANYTSNFLLSLNPGINYGTEFLDFGISINNLALYNFGGAILKKDSERGIELHAMYTGHLYGVSFFDASKFSGIIKTEIKKDQTVISGLAMVDVKHGFWAQTGFNTLYGFSVGLGINLMPGVAIEYNFERGIRDFANLGASHEFTIAYKLKDRNYYEEDESALIDFSNRKTVKKHAGTASRQPAGGRSKISEELGKADSIYKVTGSNSTFGEINGNLTINSGEELVAKDKEKLGTDAKGLTTEFNALQNKLVADSKVKPDAEDFKLKGTSDKIKTEGALLQKSVGQNTLLDKDSASDSNVKADSNNTTIKAKNYKVTENVSDQESKLVTGLESKSFKENVVGKKTSDNAILKKDKKLVTSTYNDYNQAFNAVEDISNYSKDLNKIQKDLLLKFREKVIDKQSDLDYLKHENQLNEKQFYKEPKAFKSLTEENRKLEELMAQINEAEIAQKDQIDNLINIYNQRLKKVANEKDSLNIFYSQKINELKAAQLKIQDEKAGLILNLENIKQSTEIEKKNRIKRAVYENEHNRYAQDIATLKSIKETTKINSVALAPKDFDFGESQTNLQVFKNIKNYVQGYYLVIAVHSSIEKRDKFLIKAFSAGCKNVDFFYNAQTSRYYIYYQRYDDLDEAIRALEEKDAKPYNGKMAIIKLEN
jgi:type IX secretion system PorP/SprF family membrane protein